MYVKMRLLAVASHLPTKPCFILKLSHNPSEITEIVHKALLQLEASLSPSNMIHFRGSRRRRRSVHILATAPTKHCRMRKCGGRKQKPEVWKYNVLDREDQPLELTSKWCLTRKCDSRSKYKPFRQRHPKLDACQAVFLPRRRPGPRQPRD
jgi:hypothetical protein